jgi:Cu/Ag efflux pump CusA
MVLLSVPLACVGGVAAVLLSEGDVSLGSMVGFVTVFGIAIRNGILLVSHLPVGSAQDSRRSVHSCSAAGRDPPGSIVPLIQPVGVRILLFAAYP